MHSKLVHTKILQIFWQTLVYVRIFFFLYKGGGRVYVLLSWLSGDTRMHSSKTLKKIKNKKNKKK